MGKIEEMGKIGKIEEMGEIEEIEEMGEVGEIENGKWKMTFHFEHFFGAAIP